MKGNKPCFYFMCSAFFWVAGVNKPLAREVLTHVNKINIPVVVLVDVAKSRTYVGGAN